MPRLKVFRTATGFHDAYVAAPSRAAALRAWGSEKDLFARGAAEEVTDPALTADALAAPGTVIRRLRGTAEEQIAALPPDAPKRTRLPDDSAPTPRKLAARRAVTPKPEPGRSALDEAEAAIEHAHARQKETAAALAEREAQLARERRDLARTQASELRRADARPRRRRIRLRCGDGPVAAIIVCFDNDRHGPTIRDMAAASRFAGRQATVSPTSTLFRVALE